MSATGDTHTTGAGYRATATTYSGDSAPSAFTPPSFAPVSFAPISGSLAGDEAMEPQRERLDEQGTPPLSSTSLGQMRFDDDERQGEPKPALSLDQSPNLSLDQSPDQSPNRGADLSADALHLSLWQATGVHYLAPLTTLDTALDVGSGGGAWAREMASAFPQARIVGVDITPPAERPTGYTFVQANALQGLPFANGRFDFTHMRQLAPAIPVAQWARVLYELARVTRSGGWVELVEAGPAPDLGPAYALAQVALRERGIDPWVGPRLGAMLLETGFQRVQVAQAIVPLGPRGGAVGEALAARFLAGLAALRPYVVASGVASGERYDQELLGMRYALERGGSMQPFIFAYGQRG